MMKYSLLKRLAALGVCCALATTFAFAASTIHKTVTIEYASIKLVVDGVEITPKDANGATVEPFILNGTTYLPVRAVGNAIGKQVSWDGTSKTVYLGEAPNARNWLMSVCPPYSSDGICADATFKMDGKTYTHGFYTTRYDASYAYFNLNGSYSTLSVDIGHYNGDIWDKEIEIYLDGDLTQVIELPAESLTQHFDIPLHGALQMKIACSDNIGFANAELK